MNRHKQTTAQVGLPVPMPSLLHTQHLCSHTCSLTYLHVQVSVPHVILRIRFTNSYSLKWTNSLREFRGMCHQPRTCGGVCDFLRKFRETLNPSGAKSKVPFLAVLDSLSSRKNRKRYDSTLNIPFARVCVNYSNLLISLVFKTIDSHTDTCYSLLPFKGRTILLLLNSILLRSINPQTELSCMYIHRDYKIKYQHTLFDNRRNLLLFRVIYPILYYVVLVSLFGVMITNTNNIKYKGLNLDFNLHTYVGMTVEFGDSTDEWLLAIYDLEIAQEVEDLERFDALHMHDDIEKVMTRFETFGSKFSGDIAKQISKSFNMTTPSEVQIRPNGE